MKNIILTLTIALSLLVCGCNQKKTKTTSTSKSTTVTEQVSSINYLTVEDLLSNAANLTDTTIYVSGIIDHVCKHGGHRFKILSSDGSQELKIELADNLEVPSAEVAGCMAKVKGMLKPVKMDADMVLVWEKQMKASHKGEENTEHYKEELKEIQDIYKQIKNKEISFYTIYTISAETYEIK